jgi:hypothetical protein
LFRPLWREDGSVNLLLLLQVLASAVPLGSESHGTQDQILLFKFLRLPDPGEPGPRIYIPLEQGGLDIPPGTGFPFCRLLRLTGLRWRYSIPPPDRGGLCSNAYIYIYFTVSLVNKYLICKMSPVCSEK